MIYLSPVKPNRQQSFGLLFKNGVEKIPVVSKLTDKALKELLKKLDGGAVEPILERHIPNLKKWAGNDVQRKSLLAGIIKEIIFSDWMKKDPYRKNLLYGIEVIGIDMKSLGFNPPGLITFYESLGGKFTSEELQRIKQIIIK